MLWVFFKGSPIETISPTTPVNKSKPSPIYPCVLQHYKTLCFDTKFVLYIIMLNDITQMYVTQHQHKLND